MWGQIVMKDLVGAPDLRGQAESGHRLGRCRLRRRRRRHRRRDRRSAHLHVQRAGPTSAAQPTAPAANCLTPPEADAIDKIWDGPRNAKRQQGLVRPRPRHQHYRPERHEPVRPRRHAIPLGRARPHFRLEDRDRSDEYPAGRAGRLAQHRGRHRYLRRSRRVQEAAAASCSPWSAANDQLIMPRGVINYYRQMASAMARATGRTSTSMQKFYRLFRAPGAGHCARTERVSARWSTGSRTASRRSRSSINHGRRRPSHASPLPVSADRHLQRHGQHQRRGQLPLRRRSRDARRSCARTCSPSTSTRPTATSISGAQACTATIARPGTGMATTMRRRSSSWPLTGTTSR